MAIATPDVVAWVATFVIPHEPAARRWLARQGLNAADRDDVVQEAYCRIAALNDVSHVSRPKSYLFQVLRNLVLERRRRDRVVPMLPITEELALSIPDEGASPDRIAAARAELVLVEQLIAGLPERCRQIFVWKRIEGLSQKEIAVRLGVSETIVENDVMKGLRLIMAGMADTGGLGDGAADGDRQRA